MKTLTGGHTALWAIAVCLLAACGPKGPTDTEVLKAVGRSGNPFALSLSDTIEKRGGPYKSHGVMVYPVTVEHRFITYGLNYSGWCTDTEHREVTEYLLSRGRFNEWEQTDSRQVSTQEVCQHKRPGDIDMAQFYKDRLSAESDAGEATIPVPVGMMKRGGFYAIIEGESSVLGGTAFNEKLRPLLIDMELSHGMLITAGNSRWVFATLPQGIDDALAVQRRLHNALASSFGKNAAVQRFGTFAPWAAKKVPRDGLYRIIEFQHTGQDAASISERAASFIQTKDAGQPGAEIVAVRLERPRVLVLNGNGSAEASVVSALGLDWIQPNSVVESGRFTVTEAW